MKINFDYHNHSPLSRCSKKDYTVEQMLRRMKEIGLTRAGISDHYYPETNPVESVAYVREQADKVEGIEVFVGVEADMLAPGVLSASEETLSAYDYVSVACPHWQSDIIARPVVNTRDALVQAQYDYMLTLSQIPYVDVVVHPFTFGSASTYIDVDQKAMMACYTIADYDRIIDGFLKNDIACELHANLKKSDYAQSLEPFIRRCCSRGVKFSLGSDAHEIRWVGSILGASELIASFNIPDELAFVPTRRH